MELYTNDLLLRTVTDSDVKEVARMWEFEKGVLSIEEAKQAIEYMKNNHEKNKAGSIYHLCFAVFEKNRNGIIGWCGLDGLDGRKLHIFYSIHPDYRNKGYATQCAEKLLSYAFHDVKVPFVNGGCDKNNNASKRVMEKIGMKQNGFEKNGDPLFMIDDETYGT